MSQEQHGMFCHTKLVVRIEHVQFADNPIDWMDVSRFILDAILKGLDSKHHMMGRYVREIYISDYEEDDNGKTKDSPELV